MIINRLPFLDNIKGALIILVIIGHSIQFILPTYDECFIFRLIYSFHMPLFFFVSGYLANRGRWNRGVITKRAKQLLIPFAVWAFLAPILKTGTLDFLSCLQRFLFPDKGLWFLYNLFVYSTIFNIADYFHSRYNIKHCLFTGGCYIVLFLLMNIFHTKFNCSQLCYHIVFYAIGYYYKPFDSYLKERYMNICLLFFGGFFLISVPFWVTNGVPLFYEYLNLGGIFAYFYRYIVQIVGMFFFFLFGYRYLNKDIPALQQLGASTLGIYAVQFTVIYYYIDIINVNNIVIKVILVSLFSVLTSYIFVFIVRKVKYLRLFLIGEN